MRVIAGSLKRRRLFSPRWSGLRPTSDRLRETLFDILGDRVMGARVLDGCAGTGAMGIEALSRGAQHVVFVEQDARAVALITRNVAHCALGDRCDIVRGTLPNALRSPRVQLFDLVLLDPPYGAADIGAILAGAVAHLEPGGVIVLERARRAPPLEDRALDSIRVVRVGNSVLEFYGPAVVGQADAETE